MSLSTLGLMRSVYPKPASPPPKSWPSTPIIWSLQGRPLREATTAMATTWFDPPLWKSCPSTPHLCKLQCQGTSPRPSSNQKAPITVTGAHFYHCPGFLLFSKIHKSRFSLSRNIVPGLFTWFPPSGTKISPWCPAPSPLVGNELKDWRVASHTWGGGGGGGGGQRQRQAQGSMGALTQLPPPPSLIWVWSAIFNIFRTDSWCLDCIPR